MGIAELDLTAERRLAPIVERRRIRYTLAAAQTRKEWWRKRGE
jgi:hypothetical protein